MNTRRRDPDGVYLSDWSARRPARWDVLPALLLVIAFYVFLGVLLIGTVWVLLAIGRALGN